MQLLNLYNNFSQATFGHFCSLGIHPWYIQDYEKQFELLQKYALLPNVLAIGECGLDKICKSDFTRQKTIFQAQVALALQLNKPLVLHCVRAFDEVLHYVHTLKFSGTVIFHAFNKNKVLAKQLCNQGYYLSFGAAMFSHPEKMQEVLENIPKELIFLETDNTEWNIKEVYAQAAALMCMDEYDLTSIIENNFKKAFNKKLL
jgi:TatD DNase family protein